MNVKNWWKFYTGLFMMAFIIMTLFAYNGYQQRDYYAELYFGEPLNWEKDFSCNVSFDTNFMEFGLDDNYISIKELSVSMPCNEIMINNLIKIKELEYEKE